MCWKLSFGCNRATVSSNMDSVAKTTAHYLMKQTKTEKQARMTRPKPNVIIAERSY